MKSDFFRAAAGLMVGLALATALPENPFDIAMTLGCMALFYGLPYVMQAAQVFAPALSRRS